MLVVSTVLASMVSVIGNSTPASAATCPSDRSWVLVSYINGPVIYEAYTFTPVSSTPTFNVSDSRIANNNLDVPITVTFTSSQSRTYTIAATATVAAKLFEWLTATISSTITSSRTTLTGVSVTAPVPAHSGIQADYGVQAYIVTFQMHTDRMYMYGFPLGRVCVDLGTTTNTVNAPTNIEGWRVGETPTNIEGWRVGETEICGEGSCAPVQAAYISHFTELGCTGTESYYTPYFYYDGISRSWDGRGVVGSALRTLTNRSWKDSNGDCHDDWPLGNTLDDFVTIYR